MLKAMLEKNMSNTNPTANISEDSEVGLENSWQQ